MTNILCLHGCGQNVKTFRSILREFMKIGSKDHGFNFFFLEGEYPRGTGKQWFDQDLSSEKIGKMRYIEDISLETIKKSLDRLDAFINDNQINVLFGFSQGGNIVDTYLNHYTQNPIKYAVIFSSYSFVGNEFYIDTPLLNVYSEADEIVKSEYRPKMYSNLEEIAHDKAHKMPTSKPMIREILKKISEHC